MKRANIRTCRRGHPIKGANAFKTSNGFDRCNRCLNRMKRSSKNNISFGGNRFKALERDLGRCIQCGLHQKQHLEIYNIDITVDHIDGNRENNNLDNLAVMCLKCHGAKDSKRRGRHLVKLKEEQIINIYHCRNKPNERRFPSQTYLAKLYGVGQPTIYRIQRGIRCKEITGATNER